jgi:anhydro-N-acetylmuramic acid kinase
MAYLDRGARTSPPLVARALRVAGVMTGTSCDGLDVACVRFDGPSRSLAWKPLWSASASYPASLKKRVLGAQAPGFAAGTREWLALHRDLGQWYGQALKKIIARHHASRPHLIANHGQTLAHFPGDGLTLQLGDPSLIARATGISTAAFFREGDLAAGGQGAPLVPRFHALIARDLGWPRRSIAIHNLGGISNLTYLGPGGRMLAFDTGPGNLWIDAAASIATRGRLGMDRGGRIAREGEADAKAVRATLAHPYFAKAAPKSTGRDDFPLELLLSRTRARGADLVATATTVTIESVARAYEALIIGKRLPLDAIYFCGGGAKNPTLLDGVRARLPGVDIHALGSSGAGRAYDPQLVEAQAFAHSGCLALLGEPIGGSWTGARGFGPPAHLIPGENWPEAMSRLRGTRSPR